MAGAQAQYLNSSFLTCPLAVGNHGSMHERGASRASFQLYFTLAPVAPGSRVPSSVRGPSGGLAPIPTGVMVQVVGNVRVFGAVPRAVPMAALGQPEQSLVRFSGWGFATNLSVFAQHNPVDAENAHRPTECRLCTAESPSVLVCPFASDDLGLAALYYDMVYYVFDYDIR